MAEKVVCELVGGSDDGACFEAPVGHDAVVMLPLFEPMMAREILGTMMHKGLLKLSTVDVNVYKFIERKTRTSEEGTIETVDIMGFIGRKTLDTNIMTGETNAEH